jgi:hypothetical protein
MNFQQRRGIGMRELQKMSSAQIEALPHPVPITNGGRTIAILKPMRKPDIAALEKLDAEGQAIAAARTPEKTAELQAKLDAIWASR